MSTLKESGLEENDSIYWPENYEIVVCLYVKNTRTFRNYYCYQLKKILKA